MKKISFITLAIVLVMLGCSKSSAVIDPPTDPPTDPPVEDPTFQDLEIAPDFDFESTQTVDLDINLPSEIDYSTLKSSIQIYYIDNEIQYPVTTVSCNTDGVYQGSIVVPSFVNTLYVANEAGSFEISISDQSFKSSVAIDYDTYYYNEVPIDSVDESASNTKSVILSNNYASISKTKLKATTNIIGNGDFSEDDFGYQTYWSSPMTVDGKWHFTRYFETTSGQFDEDGEKMLRIARPTVSYYYGGATQLVDASPGDRITASADVRLSGGGAKWAYIYLIPRRSNGSPIAYYSRYIGTTTGGVFRNYSVAATMPAGTESVQVLLWNRVSNGQIDYDNVIVTGPVVDADNDGINDEEDAYPNDAERAFNVYYPSSETYASIAFEDNWPGRGDYDFNDLVIDYQYKTVTNASNAVKDLDAIFRYRAIGATFQNGFGFEMNTAPSNVSSVTGYSITEGNIDLTSNGLESGQSKAVVIATDNAFNQLTHPGSGIGVNTTIGAPYVDPVMQTIEVRFDEAVSASDMGAAPYNVFMIVNQDRGREIHLPDNEPTDLVNSSYFGSEHDDTQIANKKYYKTSNNLPWAINIPSSYAYPNEKIDIVNAHLKFSDWAESSGASFVDWYLDKTGYRNSGNIFQVPN